MPRFKDGRQFVDVTGNKTLTAADSGIVQNVLGDFTITMPATANQLCFIVRNGGKPAAGTPAGSGGNQSAVVTVAPQAADGVTGNGYTATVNKAVINTKATSVVGDEITLGGTGTTGVTGYVVQRVIGTWDRQA